MRIGIYIQPTGSALGGVDCLAAVLADGLVQAGQAVEIIHHKPFLNMELLQSVYGVELPGVTSRCVPRQPNPFGTAGNPLRRYRQAQHWHADVSDAQDCTISLVTEYPPFCHSPRGILYVVFPSFGGFERWPFQAEPSEPRRPIRQWLSSRYHHWEWRQRLAGYQHWVAISDYSATWAKTMWGIDCATIYPPVDLAIADTEKQPMILTVGRFDHWKKQREMIGAFTDLRREHLIDWSFTIAGGLDDSAYFKQLRALAESQPVALRPNVKRPDLRDLYGHAAIYWHAAGYGNDDTAHPEQTEHFGITTVEAMAAGCVPVVINKAGQRETVEHGVSGFLWDTLDELRSYTARLIADHPLRQRMSQAARARSQRFAPSTYVNAFRRLVESGTRPPVASSPKPLRTSQADRPELCPT